MQLRGHLSRFPSLTTWSSAGRPKGGGVCAQRMHAVQNQLTILPFPRNLRMQTIGTSIVVSECHTAWPGVRREGDQPQPGAHREDHPQHQAVRQPHVAIAAAQMGGAARPCPVCPPSTRQGCPVPSSLILVGQCRKPEGRNNHCSRYSPAWLPCSSTSMRLTAIAP